jgi:hypothetical protein
MAVCPGFWAGCFLGHLPIPSRRKNLFKRSCQGGQRFAPHEATDELRAYMKAKTETTLSIMVQAAREHENSLVRFRVGEIVRTIAPQRAEAEGL